MEELKRRVTSVLNWNESELNVLSKCGGLTNENFLMQYKGQKYVLRKSTNSANILSINRKAEFEAAKEAKKVIKTPNIIYFDDITGDMVSEFIDGKPLEDDDFIKEAMLEKIVVTLKLMHQQHTQYFFKPFDDIVNRIEYAKKNNVFDFDYKTVTDYMYEIKEWLSQNSDAFLGLCHNDPFAGNFILNDDDIYVLDFEYSAMGDILFDIACLAWGKPNEYHEKLLKMYFGKVDDCMRNRLRDIMYISQLWNASWALVKYVDGAQGYDYYGGVKSIFDSLVSWEK
jgi:thiamine kinase-like enzyme